MKKTLLAITIALLVPGAALAAETHDKTPMKNKQRHYVYLSSLITSGTALNGAVATRSFATKTAGWKWLNVKIAYTHNQNGTLTLLCDNVSSTAVATNTHYTRTTCTTSEGACALNFDTGAVTSTLSADKNISILVRVEGRAFTECSVTHSSPTADDTIEVTGELVAG